MGVASSRLKTLAHSTRNGQNANKNQNNAAAKRTTQGPHASSENAEEQKMAIVLFFIVALYLGVFALGFMSNVSNRKILFFLTWYPNLCPSVPHSDNLYLYHYLQSET